MQVWSSIKWDVKKKMARVWMPRQLVERLGSDGWVVDVLRIDLWCVCSDEPVSVKMVMRGMKWVNWGNGDVENVEQGVKRLKV